MLLEYGYEYEIEIMEAIINLNIENEVKVFTGEEKEHILSKLQEIFVTGNPRVWWLSLKYKPISFIIEEPDSISYKRIADFFDKEEVVWFVVEDDARLLYRTKVSHVVDIIGQCRFFEYNIISKNLERFLCETEHDEFLYIDINKNPSKE